MGNGVERAVARDIAFRDRAAYLKEADTLVVADLHLGRAATSAVDAPLSETDEIIDRIAALTAYFRPREVVVAGDVLHAFDGIPAGIDEGLEELRAEIEPHLTAPIRLVSGNHDTMLADIADPVAEYRLADDRTVVCHGHERPQAEADRFLLGHEHPAIDIEGTRHPCYLYGRGVFAGSDVLMLPAFNRLTIGTSVNRLRDEDIDSPLLQELGRLRPILRDEVDETTLTFPALEDLRGFL